MTQPTTPLTETTATGSLAPGAQDVPGARQVPGGAPTALVTGASRGIGAHIVRALLEAGWQVVGLSRSGDVPEGVVDGAPVTALACDVTDVEAVDAAVARAGEILGRVDLLVNNAGLIEVEAPLWGSDPQEWWQVVETNVRGPYLVSRAVVPLMIASGGGRVVNLNSGAGTRASADLSAYAVSKTALFRITGAIALAGAEHGVHAFDLAPGVVRTDMTGSMAMHKERTEWTDPADVTALVLALASGELDAFSGRMVRAGADTPEALTAAAQQGLDDKARTLTLRPWGEDDPVAG